MRLALDKWYLDCTTDAGDAVVIYVARASLGPMRLHVTERLLSLADAAGSRANRRLSRAARVREEPDRLALSAPALGFSGTWVRRAPAIDVVLFDGAEGRIRWRCHLPSAEARVDLSRGLVLRGTGYAERMALDWTGRALPFRRLRWGRFIAPDLSVVWIDWSAGLERRWVFVDGVQVGASAIDDRGIACDAGRLEIEPGRVLRSAPLADTIGGRVAWMLPRRFAGGTETKRFARARFDAGRGPIAAGQVVHEVVTWD